MTSSQLENIQLSLLYPTVLFKGYLLGQVAGTAIVLWTNDSEVPQSIEKLCPLVFTTCRVALSTSNSAHLPWGVLSAPGTPVTFWSSSFPPAHFPPDVSTVLQWFRKPNLPALVNYLLIKSYRFIPHSPHCHYHHPRPRGLKFMPHSSLFFTL